MNFLERSQKIIFICVIFNTQKIARIPAIVSSSQIISSDVAAINYSLVVRSVTPHVGSAVYQPSHVQRKRVSEESGNEESTFKTFTPEVHGHKSWDVETEDGHQPQIITGTKKQNKNTIITNK